MTVTATQGKGQGPHLRRALGLWDLTWLTIVAVANLNVVPIIAASGPTTMWLWLAALLFFFLPQGIAVVELSRQLPGEGGVYVWTKEMFGDLHGFLCGWCYWTAQMFFIPSLLFYLLGLFAYIGGPRLGKAAENPIVFAGIAIALLWLTALANIRNIGIGKWVNNVGGIGTLIAAVLLISLAAVSVFRFGVSIPADSFHLKHLDLNALSSFGVICFALVGLELGCVMGDEIQNPARNVPRGVMYGGVLSALQYVGATFALLLAISEADVKVVQGVVQAVDKMTVRLGAGWMLTPFALMIAVSVIGAVSAWLSGSARIVFVSGIDQYLPRIFGKLHKRHETPYIALCGIAVLSSLLILMSIAGSSTVKEAYVTLVDLAVVLQMICYSYVYLSLFRIAFGRRTRVSAHPWRIRFASVSGIATTLVGLVVAFIPSHQVASVWRFEIKMISCCVAFVGFAAVLFYHYSRKRSRIAALPIEA